MESLFSKSALAPFVIITPIYNSEKYVEKCIKSVKDQSFGCWHIIIIDDCSSDNTVETIKSFVIQEKLERRITLICNDTRSYQLHNICFAIRNFVRSPNAIIGLLDGDDWLARDDALELIWEEYGKRHDLVWSQHVHCPYERIGDSLPANKWDHRSKRRGICPFRTFRKYLFDRIPDSELRDQNGEYFRYTGDKALMYPMSELASNMKFLDKILYVYNRENPNNVDKLHMEEQTKIALYLESKKPIC